MCGLGIKIRYRTSLRNGADSAGRAILRILKLPDLICAIWVICGVALFDCTDHPQMAQIIQIAQITKKRGNKKRAILTTEKGSGDCY
jgi:hypothetical protein